MTVLIGCIKSHTSVNLQGTARQTAAEIAEKRNLQFSATADCVEFVKSYFPMLGIAEVKDAFSMLSAGRLTADIQTYGGEFEPMHLGRLLSAYVKFRKNVIAEYEKKFFIENKEKSKEEKDELRAYSGEYAKLEYAALLRYYQEMSDPKNKDVQKEVIKVVEDSVKSYWGKILVSDGVIVLSDNQRHVAKGEAKEYTLNKLKNARIDGRLKDIERLAASEMMKSIGNKDLNRGFVAKWSVRYAKIIIIKSILNTK